VNLRPLIAGAALALCCGTNAVAQTTPPTPASAQEVIARMLARNAGLKSYMVRVHVKLRTVIPFYSPSLDGTAYFKRPDSFAVVFDRVPSYGRPFQKLFDDVGDPTEWEKDSNITLQGIGQLDGRPMIVLVLTKKIYSDQIKDAVVYVDPTTYELPEMDWHYTNGGSIVMKQYYSTEDGFSVVSRQHVDIHYRVRATGDSQYEPYHTNVPIDDSVFVKQP
jgi:outer membrane lipoprotein-sorting protein